ncbi:unnamed protein product [Pieris brassicae]|uniref:Uncharacterized protein n=1 Tax=Pieris brassicae TaxID=7116 RepID=A0A9P0TSV6_PIEBR|nr:unnamed protein product [Pieris brassicae]
MDPKKKKLSREELLQKNDPEKREKEKSKYQKKKEKDPEEDTLPMIPATPVPVHISPASSPAVSSTSLQQRRKEATKRQQKNNKIARLEKKLEKYKKRLSRFNSKNKKIVEDTPKTKILKMLEEPDQRKEVVKNALFGDVIRKQLKEN